MFFRCIYSPKRKYRCRGCLCRVPISWCLLWLCVGFYHMASVCCVFSRFPRPAGYVPPVCSDVPGCGPLSRERERRMSVAAELPSGTKLLWMRSLICLSFDTDASQSQSVSLSCSDCASEVCSSSLRLFFCISDKHTPVFAKGERERAGNRLLEHRPKRSAPCSFLFCFFFSFSFVKAECLLRIRFQAVECKIIHSSCSVVLAQLEILWFLVACW